MHIHDVIEEKAHENANYAVAYALLKLAEAHRSAASALHMLGTGNAATQMGAIELLSSEVGRVVEALSAIADRMPEE